MNPNGNAGPVRQVRPKEGAKGPGLRLRIINPKHTRVIADILKDHCHGSAKTDTGKGGEVDAKVLTGTDDLKQAVRHQERDEEPAGLAVSSEKVREEGSLRSQTGVPQFRNQQITLYVHSGDFVVAENIQNRLKAILQCQI